MHQLPDGFELFDHICGPAIKFNYSIVASASAPDPVGSPDWCVTFRPCRPDVRSRGVACRYRAEQLMVAWARKYESELRQMYRQRPTWADGPARSRLRPCDDPLVD